MKYYGIEHTGKGSDSFTSEESLKIQPHLYIDGKIIFEIESDSWEEASHAWSQFRYGGSYNPVCPGDCFSEGTTPGTLDSDPSCPLCSGKGWVTMEIWRRFKAASE